MKPFYSMMTIYEDTSEGFSLSEIENHISGIPYKENPLMVWKVNPKEKYIATIKKGDGNCSNLTYGAAYDLIGRGGGVSIIHFLPKDLSFLSGNGHTVLQIKGLNSASFIADYYEGGIPYGDGELLNFNNIEKEHRSYTHRSHNLRKDNYNPYFQKGEGKIYYYGIIPQAEIVRYFGFIQAIYFDLHNEKLSKFTYDFVALILGYYPKTYVDRSVIEDMWNNRPIDMVMANILKYSFYLFFFSLFLLVLYLGFLLFKNLRNTRQFE